MERRVSLVGGQEYKSSPDWQANMSLSVEFDYERLIPNHKFGE